MTKATDNKLAKSGQFENDIESLMKQFNREPDPAHIKNDGFSKKDYLPISVIEALLDQEFGPLNWKTTNFKVLPLGANPGKEGQVYIAATITLAVINTNFGEPIWVEREGATSGYCSHGVIATFAAKLKAEAIKNAAKSLGKVFGRDLNRKHQEDVTGFWTNEGAKSELLQATSLKDLVKKWNDLPKEVKADEEIQAIFAQERMTFQK